MTPLLKWFLGLTVLLSWLPLILGGGDHVLSHWWKKIDGSQPPQVGRFYEWKK